MFKTLFDTSSFTGFAAAATVIFFVLFAGVVVWTLLLKKPYISKMRNLPLDSGTPEQAEHQE